MKTVQAGLFDTAIPVAQPTPPGRTTVTTYNGDCLDVMPRLKEGSVAFMFADVPYATLNAKTTDNYWDVPFDIKSMWPCARRVLDKNGVSAMTGTQPFASSLIAANLKDFKYDIIWNKVRPSRFLHAKRMPLLQHESILIFYKSPCTYNPQMTKRDKPMRMGGTSVGSANYSQPNKKDLDKKKIYTHRFPTTIITAAKENFNLHPTQKPVALIEWLIRTYTNDGDTILDPTAGSGTAAIAAMNVGNRHVICIEKDPTYYDIMCKRIAKHRKALGQ